MEEIWRDIVGYEGLYQVSNMGRVRSLDRIGKGRWGYMPKKGVMLSQTTDTSGYKIVNLWKDNIIKSPKVHRLVAQAFIPNPSNLPQVNHKDEVKTNNCVDNLEWCSVKYNNNYGTRIERVSNSMKGKHINRKDWSKPILQFTKQGEFVAEYPSIREAVRQTGIIRQNISSCCNNKRNYKSAGGYVWKFKN